MKKRPRPERDTSLRAFAAVRAATAETEPCPECHTDLSQHSHKMSCSIGGAKGRRAAAVENGCVYGLTSWAEMFPGKKS